MLPKIKKLVFEVEFQQIDSPYQGRSADIFLTKFNELKQSLLSNLQEFIPVEVVPRQPPPHLIAATGRASKHIYLDSKKNKLVEFPRRNSFEIYVDRFHLFSRLESGTWPDVPTICEWALRVAEKIVDLQIQKEEGPLKDYLQNEQITHPHPLKDNNQQPALNKLPPVLKTPYQSLRKKPQNSPLSNYYPRSRYSSLRDDESMLPYGTDPMNRTITNKIPYLSRSTKARIKVNSIDRQAKTITRNFYQPEREQSFHWHIKEKVETPKLTPRYNDILINKVAEERMKTPNIELSPLPAVHNKPILDKQDDSAIGLVENVELRLSQSPLNCYKKYYRIQGNKVTKITGDELWSPILCETPLPLLGQYSFQILIKTAAQSQVQLGIAPLNYYPRLDQPDKGDNLISFNCGSGLIKDAKHNKIALQTFWREGGIKTMEQPPYCLKAVINAKTKIIQWFVNDTISASSKLPSQYNAGFRAFVSLYNTRDCIFLNQAGASKEDRQKQANMLSKEKEAVMTNAYVQTTQERQKTPPLLPKQPIVQNKIYPNSPQKEAVSMIDQMIQVTPVIEGRIKKQRFHQFLEKANPQKQKTDLKVDDIKIYNQALPFQETKRWNQTKKVDEIKERQKKEGDWQIVENEYVQERLQKQHIISVTIKQQPNKEEKIEEKAGTQQSPQMQEEVIIQTLPGKPVNQQIQIQPDSIEIHQSQAILSKESEIARNAELVVKQIQQTSSYPKDETIVSKTHPSPEQPAIKTQAEVDLEEVPQQQPQSQPQPQPIMQQHESPPQQSNKPDPALQITNCELPSPPQREQLKGEDGMSWQGTYQSGTFKLKMIRDA